MQEARFYSREKDSVICRLCPQECNLKEEQEGICGVRRVEGGRLLTMNYGLCGALAFDPVEKKPLYHFYPGYDILSLGSNGCNLHCSFCQNWALARGRASKELKEISAKDLLDILGDRPAREQLGIAYTYNEPTVWYEFVRDTAEMVAGEGYKNVLVTNGFINEEPLKELLPFIHGMNIDVKAFQDSFYRRYCHGKGYKQVLKTVELALSKCHVELTYLIVTSLNDSPEEIRNFIDWVASLDKEIPVHFSRYFPGYRLDMPPTPLEIMENAWETAREKLSYVYLGNVADDKRSSTYCPDCGQLLISRNGYRLKNIGLKDKSCKKCGHTIMLTGHIYGEKV
ncbi:MAG TPA: AmmeMemoRadiSam system radical SAM enzyme [Firmicutes bacterium]|jgi:pyruvate formate lyase activating enzyme|nr:AmmeMemoRadiSam system radical SAM enzyme [Bacillota bacterium]